MTASGGLPTVTARELSKRPGQVLERVALGERLIVSRHGRPIATLQPLNGFISQPIEGVVYDVTGTLMLLPHQEVEKLTPLQRELIADCVWRDVIKTGRAEIPGNTTEAMADLAIRGLVRRTHRGMVLTGRAFALRDAIYERRGKPDPRYASGQKSPSAISRTFPAGSSK